MTTTSTATDTARKVFKVLGTTDEVTECQHCGRVDLKGTIRLGELDADGNIEGITYFGAVCGAKAAGWTTREIRKAAKTADDKKAASERAAKLLAEELEEAAFMVRFTAWLAAEYGITGIRQVSNLAAYRKSHGMTPYDFRTAFEAVDAG